MQRTVRCQLGLLVVDDSFCEAMTKPIDEQTCMSLNCSPDSLLEANTRLGGWIHSNHTQHGSVHELGTRSIRPAGLVGENTLDMLHRLQLEDHIIPVTSAHHTTRNRFIYAKNGIHKLPSSLSSLFQRKEPFSKSLASYLVKEPFQRKSKLNDESIKDFFERRFGSEIATYLVDAFCRGIYAGKSSELSIKSCFPSLFASDKKYGSVIHPWWNAVKARRSLGLPFTPRVWFLEKRQKEQQKQLDRQDVSVSKSGGQGDIGNLSSADGEEKKSLPNVEVGRVKDWRKEKRLQELKEMKPASDEEVDDDDDDDLPVIKKENVFGIKDEESAGEDDEVKVLKETTAKKGKTLTKVAALKKLAKKQRNTKVGFKNEDVGIKGSEDEEEEYEKGLDLKEAQEYMRKADEEDKKRFRERVKAKHKEERLKKKQAKQKKDEDEESGDEGDMVAQLDLDNEFEEFDASKLPDPGSDSEDENKNDDDESKESEEEGEAETLEDEEQTGSLQDKGLYSSSSDESEERPVRRKRKPQKSESSKQKNK